MIGTAVFLTEVVNRLQERGIPEVKGSFTEGTRQQLQPDHAEGGDRRDLLGAILGQDHIEVAQGLPQECRVSLQPGIQEAELLPVKLPGDLLGAAEVEHPEFPLLHEEIPGMRIGVEDQQVMHLMAVEIPQSLSDPVAFPLGGLPVGEAVERHPVDPVRSEDPARREFRMIRGEAHPLQMRRGLRQLDRPCQLVAVVGLFQQARLHLTEVGIHVGLPESEDAERDRLHDGKIAPEALGHAGILDLDRILAALVACAMHLADGSAV